MGRINIFLFFVFGAIAHAFAQDGRYAIFMSDKTGSSFSIDNPSAFLSQRSIERRVKQGINVTDEDFPVSQIYVQQVKETGAKVLYSSRWFNALVIEVVGSQLSDVLALPFVTGSEFLAPKSQASGGRIKRVKGKRDSNLNTVNQVQMKMLGIDEMHNDNFLGENVVIGVFDSGFTGVDVGEPFKPLIDEGRIMIMEDLLNKSGNVFQYDDHGTEILSIMAADQVDLYRGGAPKATYQLFVTEDVSSEYRIEEYNWLIAAERADSAGVDIINSSLGYNLFDDESMDYTIDQLDGETAVVSRAAAAATRKGILVVSSGGNDGNTSWKFVNPPSDVNGVLAVGSVTSTGTLSNFSSIGPTADGRIKPDVVALGTSVSVIKANGTSGFTSGTSASTPLISGLAAGLWQAFPELNVIALYDLIISSGTLAKTPNNEMGYGIPNYLAAKEIVTGVEPPSPTLAVVVYPNPITTDSLNIDLDIPSGQQVKITIYNLQGQRVFQSEGEVNFLNNPVQIDTSKFSRGLYLMKVETIGVLRTFRVVKL